MPHPLETLGAADSLLTPEEKGFLDTNGYLSLGPLLSGPVLDALNRRCAALLASEGERSGNELYESQNIRHNKEAGADRLADLVNKGDIFDLLYTHPRFLTAVRHVLGNELRLSSLNYRAAKPGQGLQKLHADWKTAVTPGAYQVCNSIWLLDDFTKANGATRLVAGTHRNGTMPEEALDDPMQPHPDEILIEAPAGTVVVFNSHVWHGGTTNRTGMPRRAIHSYFCRRDQPQQTNQRDYIRQDTLDRIRPEARWLLDA